MKKTLTIILLAVLAVSCREKEYIYVPSDVDEDPQFLLATKTYYELVGDCTRAVEITGIFDKYQDIREDRTAALKFVSQYFYAQELYYDMMRTSRYWEAFHDVQTGLYYSNFNHGMQCLYININSKYEATETGESEFSFRAVPAKTGVSFATNNYSMTFDGSIGDTAAYLSNLEINYTKPDEKFSLHIFTPEGVILRNPLPDAVKGHKYFPESGSIIIEYEPQASPYKFCYDYKMPGAMRLELSFHGDMIRISDGQGYDKEFPATPHVFARNGEY